MDLQEILSELNEPIRLVEGAVKSWCEISYEELAGIISQGRLDEWLDFKEKYARLLNETLLPLMIRSLTEGGKKSTRGRIILSDSMADVKEWLKVHGAEFVTQMTAESRQAIAHLLLMWQEQLMNPRAMAQQIRPLIGLSRTQAAANERYRQKIYETLTRHGLPPDKARRRAQNAALKYSFKQQRYRAETILHTELAFAYNRGADIGVRRAIRQGLMTHCAMIWTTAGTLRTCARCLELKDKIVGYTDSGAVQLPPLHPRCRCTIEYEEITVDGLKEPKKPPYLDSNLYRPMTNQGAFSHLQVPMHLKAVKQICNKYGVDITGLRIKIQRDEELLRLWLAGAAAPEQIGRIDLFPNAFSDEEQILRTIIHEGCHVKQLKKYGREYVQENVLAMEDVAYRYENFFLRIVKRRQRKCLIERNGWKR